ncbi:Glucosamine kinase GspK [Sinobacterium norvegicum]|uniref:Glucosamine kinase GspK n=1 Tax=Sinobacterium norvegicum TaxID=1641715 RepID=A0ABM9ADZ0_9GAMM|nr:BadF/BadG/BcrA/BcrD ATPase family protein [Sinobacterium norvegicum]CAH0990926.1 Glucosamine kinase GspK [Sinobacterium norvegicum]
MAEQPFDNNKTLFLGIDGGGSKCRARILTADNQMLGEGVSGPANPVHGFDQTVYSIQDATLKALAAAHLKPEMMGELVAGVGLAGVNVPSYYDMMSNWAHPFKAMHLTTDLHIACLGAHNGQDGAVIIVGTGSCGFVSVNDENSMYGGHGFPYGDKGSGAWIGLQAIKSVLLAHDRLGPQTLLTDLVDEFYGLNGKIISLVEMAAAKPSSVYAKLAPAVFNAADAGDPVARAIIEDGVAYIDALAKRLLEKNPQSLALIGGVAEKIRPLLSADVQDKIVDPAAQPEFGGVYFAKKEAEICHNRIS